jgi:NAD(P)-dependent dehydrogenase (short-subunit alcohol dehydrogenase family)
MPVAVVTGASRGIGRAAAVALGRAGFDLALAARTVHEGEGRDDGDFSKGRRVIEGSLDTAVKLVSETGARVLPLPFNLRERHSIENLVKETLSQWGRIDVLVNNALDHSGNNVLISELSAEMVERNLVSNAVGPLLLTKAVLPAMIRQGGGRIINLISICAYIDPPAAVGEGGWGVLYGMGKGAVHRIAGVVAAEAGRHGVGCFSLDPGSVKTAVVGNMPFFADSEGWISESIPAAVIAWLAQSPKAMAMNGQTVYAEQFARDNAL